MDLTRYKGQAIMALRHNQDTEISRISIRDWRAAELVLVYPDETALVRYFEDSQTEVVSFEEIAITFRVLEDFHAN